MFIKHDFKERLKAYGYTDADANKELMFLRARNNILGNPFYANRRESIYSWLPTPKSLSIKDACTIVYKNNSFVNTRTGKVQPVEIKPLSQYLYLYSLLCEDLSYEDFTVTCREEVDELFLNISPEFGSLTDFPSIKPGIQDNIVAGHFYKDIVVGISADKNILILTTKKQITIETIPEIDMNCYIAYGLARIGYGYNKNEIIPSSKGGILYE